MAALKKIIDKPTFALLVIIVNALLSIFSMWVPSSPVGIAGKTSAIIIVNAVVVWLYTETQDNVNVNMENAHINAGD
jgi:peptidoglycan biosynthesis protein MviN/MurJ (putative lipid II flippase)